MNNVNLEVLSFIKTHADWRLLLSNLPYNLIIKEDDSYIFLKYNQLESDLSNSIVQECRGLILDKDLNIVSFPFKKFFNYGEQNASNIDWKSARVQEKIDGCLMTLFYDKGSWRWATNGNINADTTQLSLTELEKKSFTYRTYGDIIRSAENYKDLDFSKLNKACNYMFELVSPYTKIVISYPSTKLYHLSTRDKITLQEIDVDIGIEKPKTYPIHSLTDCITAANNLDKQHEGFVVVDKNYNRIKIKNPEYLMLHRFVFKDKISVRSALEIILSNEQEEFLSYYPQFKTTFCKIESIISKYCECMECNYNMIKCLNTESMKDIAQTIQKFDDGWSDYYFYCIRNGEISPKQYIQTYVTRARLKEKVEKDWSI